MVRFTCPIPTCREEQTMIIDGIFRVARRTLCLKCGTPLLVAVIAVTEDRAKEILGKRK
jgi:hypothetical protein